MQRSAVAQQQSWSRDHDMGETERANSGFHLALDPVVKDRRLAVGAHGADDAKPAGTSCARGLSNCQNSVKVNRPESCLAASRLDGGSQRDKNIIERRQPHVVTRLAEVDDQFGMLQAGCLTAYGVNGCVAFIGQ